MCCLLFVMVIVIVVIIVLILLISLSLFLVDYNFNCQVDRHSCLRCVSLSAFGLMGPIFDSTLCVSTIYAMSCVLVNQTTTKQNKNKSLRGPDDAKCKRIVYFGNALPIGGFQWFLKCIFV